MPDTPLDGGIVPEGVGVEGFRPPVQPTQLRTQWPCSQGARLGNSASSASLSVPSRDQGCPTLVLLLARTWGLFRGGRKQGSVSPNSDKYS